MASHSLTKKILVYGSRLWEDEQTVREILASLWELMDFQPIELIHGNDPTGADMICDNYATEVGWKITIFTPEWDEDGKDSYDVRNQKMLDYGADYAVIFFSKRSARTEKMVNALTEKGIPFVVLWE